MAAGDSDVVADAIADSKYAADISRKMQVLHFYHLASTVFACKSVDVDHRVK